jgi:hypothetical protein
MRVSCREVDERQKDEELDQHFAETSAEGAHGGVECCLCVNIRALQDDLNTYPATTIGFATTEPAGSRLFRE